MGALIAPVDQGMIGSKVMEQIDRMAMLDKVGGDTDSARFFLTIDSEQYTVVVSKGRSERD